MPVTYVLLIYLWSIGAHTLSPVSSAEFSSPERCETAGTLAKAAFGGLNVNVYYICVVK